MGTGRRKSGFSIRPLKASSPGLIVTPKTLKEALGKKGKPDSMIEAATSINPNFTAPFTEGYQINCQRCVVAYELARRGYDVEALGNFGGIGGKRDRSSVSYQSYDKGFWGNWMGAFQKAKPVYVGKGLERDDSAQLVSNIEKQMKQWGPGSRAVIQTFWKGGGGHVFNVEVDKHGKVTWLEAQVGTRRPNDAVVDIDKRSKSMIPSSVMLVRTDNLRVSDRAKEFVKPRQKIGKDN